MDSQSVFTRSVIALLLTAGASSTRADGGMAVTAAASVVSPAAVGTLVTWSAAVSGATSSNLWYRFRERDLGTVLGACPAVPGAPVRRRCAVGEYATIRDFGPLNTLDWTAGEHEGDYEIEIAARDNDSGALAVTTARFQIISRVTAAAPVVTPTSNPFVYLYSAPACPAGSTMRVQFESPEGFVQSTSTKPCYGVRSMNFYVAGMRAQTAYTLQHVIEGGSQPAAGPLLTQTTSPAPVSFGPYNVVQWPVSPMVDQILLQARFGSPAATDSAGNLVWYYPGKLSLMARPEPGGVFLGWVEGQTFDSAHQIIREFDLAGTTLRETNAARISEQLAAKGMHPITGFHHEVRAMPNGGILALASTERILNDVQGPGAVDVLGDMILVLDRNLQVTWAWDSFDHLDPHRMATLNETCLVTAAGGGCPPIRLATTANDWTHGNSLELMADGNILYSARHQDWLIKIDYRNGQGTGDVLWKLGKDGDFQFVSNDPYPWFSHQHDANIDANGLLTVFDNGNMRNALDANAHSRGQAIQIDETKRTATVLVNADLGDFSMALGSAQKLSNGDYHFHLGYITTSNSARVVEVEPSGEIVYDMHVGELEYRSFRMSSLYAP